MSFVRTVLGDVPPAALGSVNYHEHLFQVSPLLPGDDLDDEAKSGAEAALLRRAGMEAMVEATPLGLGRRPAAVARIASSAKLAVVAATGRHREAHYPDGHWLRRLSADELAAYFLQDLQDGCTDTEGPRRGPPALSPQGGPVRAGLLKAGVGYWSITAFEHHTLEAVARAHASTGAPIMVHLEFCTAAHEVLDLLENDGVATSRVVLAHADRNPDPGLHLELTTRGAYLGYDGMARPKGQTDAQVIELIATVSAGGGADRLMLGGDVARRTRYLSYGGMPGLSYLPQRFLPRLTERIGLAAVDRILQQNPARLLTWTRS